MIYISSVVVVVVVEKSVTTPKGSIKVFFLMKGGKWRKIIPVKNCGSPRKHFEQWITVSFQRSAFRCYCCCCFSLPVFVLVSTWPPTIFFLSPLFARFNRCFLCQPLCLKFLRWHTLSLLLCTLTCFINRDDTRNTQHKGRSQAIHNNNNNNNTHLFTR